MSRFYHEMSDIIFSTDDKTLVGSDIFVYNSEGYIGRRYSIQNLEYADPSIFEKINEILVQDVCPDCNGVGYLFRITDRSNTVVCRNCNGNGRVPHE